MKKMLFLLSFFCVVQAQAQTNSFFELVTAQKGNTAFRGRVPDEDREKPIEGNDYYILTFKVLKKCTVQPQTLLVRLDAKKGVVMNVVLEGEKVAKKAYKAGETFSIRVEKPKNAVPFAVEMKSEGRFVAKVGTGKKLKTTSIDISRFALLLPM